MTFVEIRQVTKSFGRQTVLDRCSLTVEKGEIVSLLGSSGSGKTTLLNAIAGFVEPDGGQILIDGEDVNLLPPNRRQVGMVFQSYALFPHLDVFENVAYGLKARGVPKAEIGCRVAEALQLVRMSELGRRAIAALSGGQQQRVALARALVIEPDVLLMDEPLGALDRQLRKEVQLEIRRLHVARPRTTLYVTHDQEEALVMSDRIAVMRAGRIVQSGTGRELYERPADAFVARFLGESNLLAGVVHEAANGRAALATPGLPTPIAGRAGPGLARGAAAVALVRPEAVVPRSGGLRGTTLERVYLGEIVAVRLRLDGGQELWSRRFAGEFPDASVVEVGWEPDSVSILADTP
jgi:ABC-type Fe3+/spermidine/putrescine transport system ATPase subunit